MEQGKYYSVRFFCDINIKYYIKCRCKSLDAVYTFYAIRVCDKNYHSFSSFGIKYHIFEEVGLEEFVEYLPDDYPDKIVYNRKQKIKMLLNGN